MTEVAFHFGAEDKLAYCCRLLRKASATGVKVVVHGTNDLLTQLDIGLWAVSPTDFVTHCDAASDATLLKHSSVHLTCDLSKAGNGQEVLLNLADQVPPGFDAFNRVIEVVSTTESDRELARGRWKHYSQQGYTIRRHDLTLKPQAA